MLSSKLQNLLLQFVLGLLVLQVCFHQPENFDASFQSQKVNAAFSESEVHYHNLGLEQDKLIQEVFSTFAKKQEVMPGSLALYFHPLFSFHTDLECDQSQQGEVYHWRSSPLSCTQIYIV